MITLNTMEDLSLYVGYLTSNSTTKERSFITSFVSSSLLYGVLQ